MKNPLVQFKSVPVRADVISSVFTSLSAPEKKILSLEKDGQLIRLKRGLYVVSEDVTGVPVDVRVCANHIYGPSYVSLQWALRYYGLIPEQVCRMTSITTKRSRKFENKLGCFNYMMVEPGYYQIGLQIIPVNESLNCLIATKEKALCDTILNNRYIPSDSIKALSIYLEDDLRIDMEQLKDFDVSILKACAECGKKKGIINNLIKIINTL